MAILKMFARILTPLFLVSILAASTHAQTCDHFYTVVSGDTCDSIAANQRVPR